MTARTLGGMIQVPTIEVEQVPDPLPGEVNVLDVREPVEWRHGRIDGALHIPLHDLPNRRDEVPGDGTVLVVCKLGGRSAQATAYLQQRSGANKAAADVGAAGNGAKQGMGGAVGVDPVVVFLQQR